MSVLWSGEYFIPALEDILDPSLSFDSLEGPQLCPDLASRFDFTGASYLRHVLGVQYLQPDYPYHIMEVAILPQCNTVLTWSIQRSRSARREGDPVGRMRFIVPRLNSPGVRASIRRYFEQASLDPLTIKVTCLLETPGVAMWSTEDLVVQRRVEDIREHREGNEEGQEDGV